MFDLNLFRIEDKGSGFYDSELIDSRDFGSRWQFSRPRISSMFDIISISFRSSFDFELLDIDIEVFG